MLKLQSACYEIACSCVTLKLHAHVRTGYVLFETLVSNRVVVYTGLLLAKDCCLPIVNVLFHACIFVCSVPTES